MERASTSTCNGYPESLMSGFMEHLACYLRTGRAQSAHQALILLDELIGREEGAADLIRNCRQLQEVIEARLADHPESATTPARSRPWLIWEPRSEPA